MVNMIVDPKKRHDQYWLFMRLALATAGILMLSGCNMGVGGVNFTLKNFDDKNYQPLMQTIAAIGWLLGLWMIVLGFFKLKVYGQMRTMMSSNTSILSPVLHLFIGTGLLYLPFLTETSLYSVWGSNDILTYVGEGDMAWTNYFRPISHLMTLIGYISFIRGWYMLSRLGKEGGVQPGTASKGFMHVLGGLLAINFLGTIDIIKHSFV